MNFLYMKYSRKWPLIFQNISENNFLFSVSLSEKKLKTDPSKKDKSNSKWEKKTVSIIKHKLDKYCLANITCSMCG